MPTPTSPLGEPYEDPFNDPELQREMRRRGIVHKPGMAAELMQDLAPLLKAEGIDIDDPNANYDIEQLNAAMARATEQHNLHLSTPVGGNRTLALQVLREAALAIAHERTDEAADLVDSLPPYATDSRPSAAHVLGAGLGLLDTWLADPELAPSLSGARILKWRGGPMRKIATELYALARKARAFDAQGSMIARHGGLLVSRGLVLAIGSALASLAAKQQLDITSAAQRLFGSLPALSEMPPLGDENAESSRITEAPNSPPSSSPPSNSPPSASSPPNSSQGSGAAFGLAAPPTFSLELLEAFEDWLNPFAGEEPPEVVTEMVNFFEMLIGVAAQMQLNLEDPDDLQTFLDVVLDTNDDDTAMQIVDVLHNYVDFRQRNDMFGEDWNDAVHAINQALSDFDPVPAELYAAIETSYDLSDDQRRAAYFNLTIVRAVDGLLEWIGKAHEITSSGLPKRADIESVAALIGVNAKGVAKLPPFGDRARQTYARRFGDADMNAGTDSDASDSSNSQEPLLVRSATELPMLACWWRALTTAELIERRGTRVRPGARVGLWQGTATTYSGDLAEHNLETAETLATIFVAEVLIHRLANDRYGFGHRVSVDAIAMLLAAVLGETPEPDEADARRGVFSEGADMLIALLVDAGLVERSSGSITVAPEFRSAVGDGIIFAMEFIAENTVAND